MRREGNLSFDIAIATKAVDLFDYYYDLYKKNFVKFAQSEGRDSPKLWQDPKAPKPKKKQKDDILLSIQKTIN